MTDPSDPPATLRYVYAVARDVDPADVGGLVGVAEAPVRLVAESGLVAVLSDVDRAAFDAPAFEERRDDLAWLAATARAHHHVVDVVGRDHTVAPLSLATVYFDDERVRAVLRDGRADLGAVLDRLTGRSEWGLKAWVRRGATAPATSDGGGRPSGAEYLRRRRQALRDRELGVDEVAREAEEIHTRVAELAVESRRHRPQEASLTGSSERQVLNGAHLVDDTGVGKLRDLVEDLADHPRLRVELTGPWVPYSFVRPAEDASR